VHRDILIVIGLEDDVDLEAIAKTAGAHKLKLRSFVDILRMSSGFGFISGFDGTYVFFRSFRYRCASLQHALSGTAN
jgi:hypothetical protein